MMPSHIVAGATKSRYQPQGLLPSNPSGGSAPCTPGLIPKQVGEGQRQALSSFCSSLRPLCHPLPSTPHFFRLDEGLEAHSVMCGDDGGEKTAPLRLVGRLRAYADDPKLEERV